MTEYGGLYEAVVSREHVLRKIKEEIEFSFVNPMLKSSYCEKFGRPETEPELMFKILFLKKLYDLTDEALIEGIKVNMAYKYFLDMIPEERTVDSSLLTNLVAKLHLSIFIEHQKEREGFNFNKDAGTYVCPAGHLAMSCYKTKSKKEGNTILTYTKH